MDARLALGSRFRKLLTLAGTLAYDSGNTSTLRMPKGFLYRNVQLRLAGSMNISSAGTAKSEAPLGLLQKIELVVDGGKTLMSVAGRDAFRMNHLLEGKKGELLAPTGTGATVPVSAVVTLHQEAIRAVSPVDSLLDTEPYTDVDLKITWGAQSTIYTGGTASINASTNVEVMVEQTTQGHEMVSLIRRLSFKEKAVTADSSEFEIEVGKLGLVQGILLRVDRDDVPVDDIVNYVSLRSENQFDHVKRVSWKALQRKNVKEFQIDGGAASTGEIAGFAYIDLTEEGMLSSALNALAANDLKLVLDVTAGSGTTRVVRASFVFFDKVPAAVDQAAA